jgi:hypothetical protein
MSESFDPYYRWLGIPPGEQPPNHYRLLGIQLFENDLDVIENAADQRMGHLRKFQTGQNASLSQKLLNEVAAAKVCLLNAEKKAAYDGQLRTNLEALAAAAAPPAPPPGPAAKPPSPPQTATAGAPVPTVRTPSVSAVLRRRRMPWPLPAAAAVGVLLIGGLLFFLWSEDDSSTVTEEGQQAQSTSERPSHNEAKKESPGPTAGTEQRAASQPGPPESNDAGEDPDDEEQTDSGDAADSGGPSVPPDAPGESDDAAADGSDSIVDPAIGEIGPMASKTTDGPLTGLPTLGGMVPSDREDSTSLPDELIPTPQKDARADALATVRELHQDEYATAKSAPEKQLLASKLLRLARETDEAAARFVLLEEAQDMAAEAGDGQIAFEAIDEMAATFQVDALPRKASALAKFARLARLPVQHFAIMQQAWDLLSKAIVQDDYAAAAKLGDTGLAAVEKSHTGWLLKDFRARTHQVRKLAARHAELEASRAQLESDPQDAEANLALGKFYCLMKGEWAKGLPMLEAGSDATLKGLAEMEAKSDATSSERVQLANAWFDLAQREDAGAAKSHLQWRAGYWYTRVAPQLAGLERATVEKKLDLIYEKPAYAVGFDGVSAYGVNSLLTYDGTHPITVEAVVTPAVNNRTQSVFSNLELAGLALGMDQTGRWRFMVREGRTYRVAASAGPAVPNQWVHLAGVFDGRNVALFVGGKLQPMQAQVATSYAPSRMPFVVGANPERHGDHIEFFCGLIDEIRVSKSVKYATRSFKPERRLSSEADTLLLLHFDESEGMTAHDWSPAKSDYTLYDTRWVDVRHGLPIFIED